jgi:cysteinyl-tRNA synthetase
MDKILGLNLEKTSFEIVEIPKEITTLAEERWQAKLQKNWEKSDEIRSQIEAMGYIIKDSGDSYEVIAS